MEPIKVSENVSLSRIISGMWRLTDDTDTSSSHITKKLEACLEQQITTIDQADIYGGYEAEELLGVSLKESGYRDKLEIVTKCGLLLRLADLRNPQLNIMIRRKNIFTSQLSTL